jgi:hypothetical protein
VESVDPLNNEACVHIPELSGCEDQFIDTVSGLSYLGQFGLRKKTTWERADTSLVSLHRA